MNAKEYLRQVKRLDDMIKNEEAARDEIREKLISTQAIQYDKEKVMSSGEDNTINLYCALMELAKEIDALILDYFQTKHRIISEIYMIRNVTYSELLYKRYIEYKRFEQIACEMNYEYQTVRNMHGYALQEFQSFLNKVQKSTL